MNSCTRPERYKCNSRADNQKTMPLTFLTFSTSSEPSAATSKMRHHNDYRWFSYFGPQIRNNPKKSSRLPVWLWSPCVTFMAVPSQTTTIQTESTEIYWKDINKEESQDIKSIIHIPFILVPSSQCILDILVTYRSLIPSPPSPVCSEACTDGSISSQGSSDLVAPSNAKMRYFKHQETGRSLVIEGFEASLFCNCMAKVQHRFTLFDINI